MLVSASAFDRIFRRPSANGDRIEVVAENTRDGAPRIFVKKFAAAALMSYTRRMRGSELIGSGRAAHFEPNWRNIK